MTEGRGVALALSTCEYLLENRKLRLVRRHFYSESESEKGEIEAQDDIRSAQVSAWLRLKH